MEQSQELNVFTINERQEKTNHQIVGIPKRTGATIQCLEVQLVFVVLVRDYVVPTNTPGIHMLGPPTSQLSRSSQAQFTSS